MKNSDSGSKFLMRAHRPNAVRVDLERLFGRRRAGGASVCQIVAWAARRVQTGEADAWLFYRLYALAVACIDARERGAHQAWIHACSRELGYRPAQESSED